MTIPPEVLFHFLKKIHNDFQSLTEVLQFDKWHALHRAIITLYGSIFELTGSCITLIDKEQIIGVPILLRSILEGYIDLLNLVHDANYGYHLEASLLKEWLKLLDEAKVGNNEFLTYLATIPNQTIDQLKCKYKELKKKGYKPLAIEEKFKRAAMYKEYRSIFNMLCCDSHNNLRSLFTRHITQEYPDDFSIVIYKASTPKDSAMHVALIADYFLKATEVLHDFLKSPVRDKIALYRSELDRLGGEASSVTI